MICDIIRRSLRCCVKRKHYLLSCDSGEDGSTERCTVYLLDGLEVNISLQTPATGKHALTAALRQLDISDNSDYFGLQFVDRNRDFRWLDPVGEVRKQLKHLEPPYALYFRMRFYVPEPHQVVEELMRYHIFLQVKDDVLAGRLVPAQRQCIDMCAYAVQSELGDFDAGMIIFLHSYIPVIIKNQQMGSI